jgi:hypothetical protein
MQPLTCSENNLRCRLEDSFSRPENQRMCPEDAYVAEHERILTEKWRERNNTEILEDIIRNSR